MFRRVANLSRAADVSSVIDASRPCWVLRIDQDFERRLMAGLPADVQIIADGRNSNTAGPAMGYANTIVENFNNEWRADTPPTWPQRSCLDTSLVQPEPRNSLAHGPQPDRHVTLLQTVLLTAISVPVNVNKGLSINCWSRRWDRSRLSPEGALR